MRVPLIIWTVASLALVAIAITRGVFPEHPDGGLTDAELRALDAHLAEIRAHQCVENIRRSAAFWPESLKDYESTAIKQCAKDSQGAAGTAQK